MPPEALSLALAASIYPPALAAVIALGRGEEVRLRVILFVTAAYATVFVTGTLILLLFAEAGATSRQVHTPSAAFYLLLGVALLWLTVHLRRSRVTVPQIRQGPSRVDRYMHSRRRILVLGVILYVVPSPILVGAIKLIADENVSTALALTYLAEVLLVMLWLIELPMVMLIVFPDRGVAILESVNGWFVHHGRVLAVYTAFVFGVYLIAVGLVELL